VSIIVTFINPHFWDWREYHLPFVDKIILLPFCLIKLISMCLSVPAQDSRFQLHCGRGFEIEQRTLRKHDVPDVYCKVKLGNNPTWTSRTVHNELSPVWDNSDDEKVTCSWNDFLLCDKEQILTIEAWDEDQGAMDGDDYLGRAQVTVGQALLMATGHQNRLELELLNDERKGTVQHTGCFVTVSLRILPFSTTDHSSLLVSHNSSKEESSQIIGLLTVLISHATDLPLKKAEAASSVKVLYGKHEMGQTSIVSDVPGCK
jgi:hypothetical protein